ncbi:hypothetical protein ILYODFUR_006050 [Ilyodon furcidens]|uniref:Uncharacterized protein n=1 Tax=Ilyodon furcidens TaxID=33524 RepID=A0ABV0SY90_9TELE
MKITAIVQKGVHLWWFLSTAVLCSVSAGGAYCAKTARARVAALGYEYPGVHGAPDLSPAADLMYPKTFSYDSLAATEPNMNSYKENQLMEAPHDHSLYGQVHPRGSGRYLLSHASRGHTADQMLHFPRGQSVREPESSLEEVKHSAPPTLAKAPSRPDPMNQHPQGRHKLLLFFNSKHDPAGDESAPNRRDMPLTGLAPLLNWGRDAYQRGIGPKSEIPILRSARLFHGRRGWAPARGLWKVVRHPGRPAQHQHRGIGVKPHVRGKAIFQGLRKTT